MNFSKGKTIHFSEKHKARFGIWHTVKVGAVASLALISLWGCKNKPAPLTRSEPEFEQVYPVVPKDQTPVVSQVNQETPYFDNEEAPLTFASDREAPVEALSTKFLKNVQPPAMDLAFIQDGDKIAFTLGDGSIRIWDWMKSDTAWILSQSPRKFTQLASSRDRKLLAACTLDGILRIWNTERWQTLEILHTGHDQILGMKFSLSGALLVTGGPHKATIWDTVSWNPIQTIQAPGYSFFKDFAFSPDGRYMVSAGGDGALRFWSLKDFKPVDPLNLQNKEEDSSSQPDLSLSWSASITQHLNKIEFSSDGKWIICIGGEPAVYIYDIQEQTVTYRIQGLQEKAVDLSFGAMGPWIAASVGDGIHVWFSPSRQELPKVFPLSGPVRAISFSPNGDWLAGAGDDGTIGVWNLGGPRFRIGNQLIRWHLGEPSAPPKPMVEVAWDKNKVRAGESATLQIKLTNIGKGEVFRMMAFVKAPWMKQQMGPIYFGHIPPIESISRTVQIPIPIEIKEGNYPVKIQFEELYGLKPADLELDLEILPADLPRLVTQVEWSEDGVGVSIGNGNGILEPMEGADIRVVVRNEGATTANNVTVQLVMDPSIGSKARLFQTEPVSFQDLAPGEEEAKSFAVLSRGFEGPEIPIEIRTVESRWGIHRVDYLKIPASLPSESRETVNSDLPK